MSSELPPIGLDKTPLGTLLATSLERTKLIDLPGIAKDNRHLRRLPWDDKLTCPYVTLSLFPEAIDPDAGPAGKDDIGYGFMLAIVSANNGYVDDRWLGTILYWRWQAMGAFHNQRLGLVLPAGVCEVRTIVVPGEPLIPAAIRNNRDAQYWYVQTTLREDRPA